MVKVGIKLMKTQELFGGDIRGVLEVAKLCDRKGVDEIHVCDHVAMSAEGHASRPGFPYPADYDGWYEPMGLLHAVAAVTERITLSSHILVAPMRPAILLAKQIATLDVLSNGRVDIGFGAGWQKQEFDAESIPFEGRFGAMCEQVEACRELWSKSPASYKGKTVEFKDFYSLPLPPQRDKMRISFGVPGTPRNFERIARLGVGYCPSFHSPGDLAENVWAARAAYAAAGRDPRSLKVTGELTMNPERETDGTVNWDKALAEAPKLIAADIDVLITHIVPHCRTQADIEPFVDRVLAFRKG